MLSSVCNDSINNRIVTVLLRYTKKIALLHILIFIVDYVILSLCLRWGYIVFVFEITLYCLCVFGITLSLCLRLHFVFCAFEIMFYCLGVWDEVILSLYLRGVLLSFCIWDYLILSCRLWDHVILFLCLRLHSIVSPVHNVTK